MTDSEANGNEFLRWMAMPFAAVIGAALGAGAFMLLQVLAYKFHGGFSPDGFYFKYIQPVVSGAIFGWLFALISHGVAPRAKVIAAVVMTTVICVIGVLMLCIDWMIASEDAHESFRGTLQIGAVLVAAVVATKSLYEDERR